RALLGGSSSLPYRRTPRSFISATQGSTGSTQSNSLGSTAGSVQTNITYLVLPAPGAGRGPAGALSSRARTSTAPAQEWAFRPAHPTASSRLAHSSTSYPATCSLLSAYGPSVMMRSPSLILIVVASAVGRRRVPCRLTPERIVSSIQEKTEASASSSHPGARSGSFA